MSEASARGAIDAIKFAANKDGILSRSAKGALAKGMVTSINKWMNGEDAGPDDEDKDKIAAFVDWARTDRRARAVMEACRYSDWQATLSTVAGFAPDEREAIRNGIGNLTAGAVNEKAKQQARKVAALKAYDAHSYVPPGQLLTKFLDANDLDWAQVRLIDKSCAGLMALADAKFEAAVWELANNAAPDSAYKPVRDQRMVEAKSELGELLPVYREAEAAAAKEAAKAGARDTIANAAAALRPGSFTGNALCVELWGIATAENGNGGYYELKSAGGERSVAELRNAWVAWKDFQSAVEAAPVPGFATWAVGNGTAQDKSNRDDIGSRSHTHQMNFSVTWKGVNQMIHVGLAGTRR